LGAVVDVTIEAVDGRANPAGAAGFIGPLAESSNPGSVTMTSRRSEAPPTQQASAMASMREWSSPVVMGLMNLWV
jgi:hypothetical protein